MFYFDNIKIFLVFIVKKKSIIIIKIKHKDLSKLVSNKLIV